ncbi:MAG: glutamate formimidoyltransferase, partial [Acidimicrobiia bacterium]|nr:glutamate formimidoyltransferase [Acidimicrobiia bacterium]
MTAPLVECVPNFSEGRDPAVIRQITDAIEAVAGVTLLDVDPGEATHRTVVTFVGPPEAVVEAAVTAGITAARVIDMSAHTGEHPRFGAMDVCPLVPVAGITMEETIELACEVGRRLGDAGLTVFLYERAASAEHRRDLAAVRAGEYEGLDE